jgi:hypothetical protein
MAKGKPRRCISFNREKRQLCRDKWTCGELCETFFTDPLLIEQCYSSCKVNPTPDADKQYFIENAIGCEAYYVKTGIMPDCVDFNLLEDTAQGQAFQLEKEAAEGHNELLKQQQDNNVDTQKKAMMVLAGLIVAIVIFLFI